eukprot:3306835-Ditylum_brightwellii.AAC.1
MEKAFLEKEAAREASKGQRRGKQSKSSFSQSASLFETNNDAENALVLLSPDEMRDIERGKK